MKATVVKLKAEDREAAEGKVDEGGERERRQKCFVNEFLRSNEWPILSVHLYDAPIPALAFTSSRV